MDAIGTSALLSATYRRYLRSLLPVRNPALAAALADCIAASPLLTKGPLLEATPPYRTGATLRDLIGEGVLHPAFARLGGPALPLDRPLYLHQEQALRKAAAGRNLVVATGTGSGKTESFLLPVLSALTAEHVAGTLGPGVRVLLLYPMNALANDQLRRLRRLLVGTPQITFGRYTGDTPERAAEGASLYESLNPGEPRLPNELLSRQEMRDEPPHVLLTNYAMLEYLLLRPADMELFEGKHGGHWRFVVLDEAHVYDGAKAEEVGMLLRRLRERVGRGQDDATFQAIATSATVGGHPRAVIDFAAKLFDLPFEWVDGDPARQDLVGAQRVGIPAAPLWGPLGPAGHLALAAAADPAAELLGRAARDPVAAGLGQAPRVAATPRCCSRTSRRWHGCVSCWPPHPGRSPTWPPRCSPARTVPAPRRRSPHWYRWARRSVTAPAARSFRPATTCSPGPPRARSPAWPRAVRTCRWPGTRSARTAQAPYSSSAAASGAGRSTWPARWSAAPAASASRRARCGPTAVPGCCSTPLPRPRTRTTRSSSRPRPLPLGTPCCAGAAGPCSGGHGHMVAAATGAAPCGCSAAGLRPVRRLAAASGTPNGCLACGARGTGMVRLLESGNEAAAAVLATALYQALPPDEELADRPGGGRKLLTFSDSRQAAAYFAPYLESSHALVRQRRLILDGLARATARDAEATVDDLIEETAAAAGRAGVFSRRESRQGRRREAARWVLRELVALDERQSLEGLGLLRVRLGADPSWRPPGPLLELGLSAPECVLLLTELLRTVRLQGALTMPEEVDPADEMFDPRRGPIYVRGDGAEARLRVLSWLPTRGVNKRLDYLRRLLAAVGEPGSGMDARDVLAGCWRALCAAPDGWLHATALPRLGQVHQVDHTWLTLCGGGSDLWRCTLCRRVTTAALRGVCPTLGCAGELVAGRADDDSHYRALYRQTAPVPLVAREHTAQWTGLEASDIQQRFLAGQVNVLSCSTTFELGVDVGALSAVLLRNMPPTTANYIQRAGRAGRRSGTAALVVTYAQRRSHDLSRYSEPESMLTGQVRAPYVPLGNPRIDRRHAHSVALAAFFRDAKDNGGREWKTAGDFFLAAGGGEPPCHAVRGYLSPVPAEVEEALRAVLPEPAWPKIGLTDGTWVDELCGLLDQVRAELAHDVATFEERRTEAFAARRSDLAARFERSIATITRRSLIGYLANRNVLPKYGFPVDTVELRTAHCDSQVGARLELNRDLSVAIHEYAPGSELIAGGVLWRSAGIYRLPGRELITRSYTVCRGCQHYREGGTDLEPACSACGRPAEGPVREYCVPEFGFVADPRTGKPGHAPPQRSWNGAVHVVSLGEELAEIRWQARTGALAWCHSGTRGRLVALAEGPGGAGFLICDWCGWGAPNHGRPARSHVNPLRGKACTGPLRWRSLAHTYETDILRLRLDAPGLGTMAQWHSLLYAVLAGAADGLEISHADIDGLVHSGADGRSGLVLFDTVPGGAGSVLRIAGALDTVIRTAVRRVASCDCGPETSCYGCLRTPRNERHHEDLSRGAALTALESLNGLARCAG